MRTRRGLSTVVGMTFGIIALATVLAYVNYSISTLDQYNQTIMAKNQQILNQDLERFQITSINVVSNRLNVTVANTGLLPINFTKIWVQNTTALRSQIDWANNYPIANALVAPGGTLKNIGYSLPLSINPSNSYYVKLLTSRSNMQQFTINSPSVAPLNIQLFALPTIVNTGFQTELVLVVTNNGSNILTNISPSPLPPSTPLTGGATCIAGPVSPSGYNNLMPGSTVIFKWDVTVTGTSGQTCTFTLTQPLQNGYLQTLQVTITANVITFGQTNLALNTGILTLNYSSFRWTQDGTTWNTGWSFPAGPTAFQIKVTNNNSTGDFWISKSSQFGFLTSGPSSALVRSFFIVNGTTSSPFNSIQFSCSYGDYCQKMPAGQTVTLYFAAKSLTNTSPNCFIQVTSPYQWSNSMLVLGKFTTTGQGGSGTQYAQTLPYIAVQTTGISSCS